MADDGFTVELEFRTKKARQQVDKFVSDSKRKFDKLKVDLGTTSSSRSAARTGGSGGGGSAGRIDRELDLRLRSQTKAIEKAQKDREKIQQRVVESQKRTADSLISIDQIKNQRLRNAAIKTRSEIFRIQKSGDAREIAQLQSKNKRLQALRRADSRLRFQEIVKQETAAAGLSKARTNALLNQQRFNKGTRRGSRDLSKLNVIVFQTQQAIEDFSFAGLRGAGNNLALMASFIGGSAGIIALLGITTITLGPMIAKFLGSSSAIDKASKSLLSFADALMAVRNAREQASGRRIQQPSKEERVETLESSKRDVKEKKSLLLDEQINLSLLKQIQAQQKARSVLLGRTARFDVHSGARRRIILSGAGFDPDVIPEEIGAQQLQKLVKQTVDKERELRNRLAASVGKSLPIRDVGREQAVFTGFPSALKKPISGTIGSQPLVGIITDTKELQKAIDASSESVKKYQQNIFQANRGIADQTKELKDQESSLTKREIAEKRSNEFLRQRQTLQDKISQTTGTLLEQKKAERRIIIGQREDEVKELLEKKSKEVDNLNRAQEMEKIQQRRLSLLQKEIKPLDDAIARMEQEKKTQQEILQLQERKSKEAERQIDSAKRKLKQLKESISATKEDARLSVLRSGDRFAGSLFGVQRGNQARFLRSAGEQRIERTTGGLRARGAPQEMIARVESRLRARLDQQIASRDRALLEKRGAFLSKQAGAAGKIGDLGRKQSLLQDLQQLQLGFAGKARTPQLAQKALQAAANTQKLLEQTFKEQQKIEQQKLQKEIKLSQFDLRTAQINRRAANAQLEAAGIKPPNAPGAGVPIAAPILGKFGLKKTNVKFQSGGPVTGPAGTDKVPSMLTTGEVVLNEQQQRRMEQLTGAHRGNMFKAMGVPGFAGGGLAGPLGRFRNVGGGTSFEGNFLPEQIPMLIAAANQRASSARVAAFNQMQFFKQKIRVLGGSKRELTQLLDPARSDQIKQSILRSIFGRQGFTQIGRPRSENAFLKDVFGELKFILRNIAAQPRVDPFLPFAGGGKVPFAPAIAQGFNSGGVASSVSNTTSSQVFSGNINFNNNTSDPSDILRALQINEMNQSIRRGA